MREAGEHEHERQETWRHEKADRMHGHDFERENLFSHLHRPQFGRKGGPNASRDQNRREQWPQFTAHRHGHQPGHETHLAIALQLIGRLQHQNDSPPAPR